MTNSNLLVAFDAFGIHAGFLQVGIQHKPAAGARFAVNDGYIFARQIRDALYVFGISPGDHNPFFPDRIRDDGNGALWKMFAHGGKI